MTALAWDRVPLSGRQLIEASAGTGKTYTITSLVLRLLIERRLSVGEILVVTFTRAAAAELRGRIRRRIRAAVAAFESGTAGEDVEIAALLGRSRDRGRDLRQLASALGDLDEAPILTLHGFCARVLAEHAFAIGAPLVAEAAGDDAPFTAALVADFWEREVVGAQPQEVRAAQRRAPPAVLTRLVRQVTARPELEVVPPGRAVDTGPALAALEAAQAAARSGWEAEGARISELLLTSPALSRSRYRKDWVVRWLARLAAWLSAPLPADAEALQVARRFTPAELAAGTKKGQAPVDHGWFAAMAALVEAHERAEAALDDWLTALQQRLVARARAELGLAKRRAGVVTFDDLLVGLRDALRGPDGTDLAAALRARHPAALIDEFQDTDPIQYEILDRIYADPGTALFLIGDPKQAIYSFRGADVFAYLAAVRDAGGDPWTLEVSHRADPRLVAATNQLFGHRVAPFLIDAIRYLPVRPRPHAVERLATVADSHAALELVVAGLAEPGSEAQPTRADASGLLAAAAAEVLRWLGAGATIEGRPVVPSDIAVLTRTNREAERVQRVLAQFGVPAVLYGDRSVLDTEEALEVAQVLAALAAPGHGARLRAALATRLVGVSGVELFRLTSDEAAWEDWVERFSAASERWRARGLAPAFRALLRDLDLVPRWLSEPRGERRLTNVLHLVELLHEESTRRHLGPAALVRWLARVRHEREARDAEAVEAMQVRLEGDAEAVRIVTMHRSKGLEYPLVICASLASGPAERGGFVLHHVPDGDHRARLHLGGAGHESAVALARREALAEGLRLAYVAVTRARHHATVITRVTREIAGAPLGYLLHGLGDGPRPEEAAPEASSPASRIAELRAFAGDDPALVRVRPAVPPRPAPPAPGLTPALVELREARRRFSVVRRLASYTGLVAHGPAVAEHEGPDHDEHSLPHRPQVQGGPRGESSNDGSERVPLHAFPRGPGPGNALHAILERADFPRFDALAARPMVDAELARHGVDGGLWGEVVASSLAAAIDTPLDRSGMRLRDLAPNRWRCEVEFTLPVGSGARGGAAAAALTATELARVLARHGSPAVRPEYADRVAALSFPALVGFLRGFIDLVFEHDGRFYVVDHKSNHLGDRWAHYAPAELAAAMAEHHYFLQAYLYSVALHRHLAARQPGYDYDRDFGGVFYLFLRGLAPQQGSQTGVYAEKPPRELVLELSQALGGPAEGDS